MKDGRVVQYACDELSRRLRAGEPCSAEEFLKDPAVLPDDPDSVLDLLYTEFLVREEMGERPSPDEWYRRFPAMRHDLEELFRIHREASAEDEMRSEATATLTAAAGNTGREGSGDESDRTRMVAGYRLLEEIGRGGMGVVYRAHQQNLNRDVALKMILSAEFASADEYNRLRNEAEAAASLQHPNIAQVYEAGEHEGCAYLSMELVEGLNLESLLSKAPMTCRSAAELLEAVSRGIHYGHERGVIHRDLKPSNIMVTVEGQPKITDFGLAKRSHPEHDRGLTKTGVLLGTPSYMAPELARGYSGDVSVHVDVYSLGAVLYETLTGRPPFVGDTAFETLTLVQSQDPVSPRHFDERLPSDLETICLKCLEKDPDRRYASADQLAGDLRRYLHDQPIVARPATPWYRLRKFTRRNRGLVAGLATIFSVLVAGVIGTSLQASRATEQQKIAETETEVAQEINTFLSTVFSSVAPQHAGNDVTMQVALDRATKSIEHEPPDHPRVEAEIRYTFALAYMGLGLHNEAEKHVTIALERARQWYGDSHPKVADNLIYLGDVHLHFGRNKAAERCYRDAMAMYDPGNPAEEKLIALCLERLATMHSRLAQFEEAEAFARKAIAIQDRLTDNDQYEVGVLCTLAHVLYQQRKLAEAEDVISQAIERSTEKFDETNRMRAISLNVLGLIYSAMKRYDDAALNYRESIAINVQLLGEEHPELGAVLINLGGALIQLEQYDDAERELRRATTIYEQHFGSDHPSTLYASAALAGVFLQTQRYDEAEPILRHVLETRERVLPVDHPETIVSRANLAGLFRRRGQFAEAEPLYQSVLDARRRIYEPDDPRVTAAIRLAAQNKYQAGDYEGAKSYYREVLERELAHAGPEHAGTIRTITRLGEIMRKLGQEEEAKALLGQYGVEH